MPSLVKIWTTRYVDKAGNRCSKGDRGARKVREQSRKWYAQFVGKDGKRKRVPLYADKQLSRTLMNELEKKENRKKAGIDDDFTEHAQTDIGTHVKAWLQSLEDKGTSKEQRDLLATRVKKLTALAGWKRLGDITQATAQSALAKLTGEGRGVQTRNFYTQAIKQLCRWCQADRRLPYHPLAGLKGGNVKVDRRHDRRPLAIEEQRALIAAAEVGPVRGKLPGPCRALLYRLALETGLRASELRSLKRHSFELGNLPSVTVAAAYSKHRRRDVLPISHELAERLARWFAVRGSLWSRMTRWTSEMMQGDLKAAGIPYVIDGTDGPLYADFHSLRHAFITAICRTDAPIGTLVELARHSDPKLTLKTYAHARLGDKAAVIAQLPSLDEQKPAAQVR